MAGPEAVYGAKPGGAGARSPRFRRSRLWAGKEAEGLQCAEGPSARGDRSDPPCPPHGRLLRAFVFCFLFIFFFPASIFFRSFLVPGELVEGLPGSWGTSPGRGSALSPPSLPAQPLKARAETWLRGGPTATRRAGSLQIHPALTKTAHQEPGCDASPATSVCTPTNILGGSRESQQLLEELAETTSSQTWDPAEGQAGQKHQQLPPTRPAKVARLSSSALLSQEEQEELGSLKGDWDWEAIFNTSLNADLLTFGDLDLLSPTSPTMHDPDLTVPGQHTEGPQGQEQVHTESQQNSLGWDETFMAAALLQSPWDEGTSDCLTNTVSMEEVFEWNDTPLPEAGKRKGLSIQQVCLS